MDLGWEMDPFGEDQQDKISAENGRLNLYRDPFLIDAYYEEHTQCYRYDGELNDSYNLQRHYSPVFGQQYYNEDQTLHNADEPWPDSAGDPFRSAPASSSSSSYSTSSPSSVNLAQTTSSSSFSSSSSGTFSSAPAKSDAPATAAGSSAPTSSLDDFIPMSAVCPICGHKFYDDIRLAAHIVVHDGVKIFHCALCGRRMKPDSLATHYSVYHPGETPTVREGMSVPKTFKCSDCPMWFASSWNCRNHAQRKHGKKRHECPECGETFDDTDERREHRFVEHGIGSSKVCEKKYTCSHCHLRFATLYTCRAHANKKHGKKQHACPDCSESFDSMEERREHRLVAHGKIINMHRPDIPLELRRIHRSKKSTPEASE